MSKLKQIIRLRNDGVAVQTIAKAVAISRNTVKKYLRLIEVKGLVAEELLQLEDNALEALLEDPNAEDEQRLASLSGMFPYFERELLRTGVTRWVLWGEYKQQHPAGFSYSRFCEHFKQWKRGSAATLYFEQEPADKLFIDFTGKKLSLVDPATGELSYLEVYVAVLGYSQLTYVQAVASQRKEDFIAATENALHFLGGVPRALVPDNLKSAVVKADKYEAELNSDFLDFANHYGTSILPARSYKPRDKAHVERAVNIAYSRIFAPLRNQVFYSLKQLNAAIAELLAAHNNKHFQQRPISRGLDKTQVLRLADGSFIDKKENILITGATGVGKSYLASALGHQACQLGYRTLYFNTQKLFSKLKMMKADGSYAREIAKIEKYDLLVLDDFGLQPLDSTARMILLEIIEDRHGRKSTIIASQLPVAKWYEIIGDSTVADAILDRMIHTAHRLELKGESLRKK